MVDSNIKKPLDDRIILIQQAIENGNYYAIWYELEQLGLFLSRAFATQDSNILRENFPDAARQSLSQALEKYLPILIQLSTLGLEKKYHNFRDKQPLQLALEVLFDPATLKTPVILTDDQAKIVEKTALVKMLPAESLYEELFKATKVCKQQFADKIATVSPEHNETLDALRKIQVRYHTAQQGLISARRKALIGFSAVEKQIADKEKAQKIKELKQDIAKDKGHLIALENRIDVSENAIASAKNALERKEFLETLVNTEEKAKTQLEQEKIDLGIKIDELNSKIAKLTEDLAVNEELKTALEKQLSDEETSLTNIKERISPLREEELALENQKISLLQELDTEELMKNPSAHSIKNLNEKIEALEQCINDHQHIIKQSELNRKSSETIIISVKDALQTTKTTCNQQNRELADFKDKLKDNKESIEITQAKIHRFDRNISQYKIEIAGLPPKVEASQEEAELTNTKREKYNLVSKIEKAEAELKLLEDGLVLLPDTQIKEILQLQKKLKDVEDELSTIQPEVDKIPESEKTLINGHKALEDFENFLATKNTSGPAQIAKLQENLAQLTAVLKTDSQPETQAYLRTAALLVGCLVLVTPIACVYSKLSRGTWKFWEDPQEAAGKKLLYKLEGMGKQVSAVNSKLVEAQAKEATAVEELLSPPASSSPSIVI